MDQHERSIIAAAGLMHIFGLAAFYVQQKKRRRTRRRYAVAPVNRQRNQHSLFANYIRFGYDNDVERFIQYTRMTPAQFDGLLSMIEAPLQRRQTCKTIPPRQRLLMTLHYLSEGCTMREIAIGHYVGYATVTVVIKETTRLLWTTLRRIVLMPPNRREWEMISAAFFDRWNMPNCVGAIDGKHVNIQAPNYKKNHSIILMASCDAYHRFTLIDIGAPGSNHDSAVFKASVFGTKLLKDELDLPPNSYLPQSTHFFQKYFVAGQAFPLHKRIMRPYPERNLTIEQRIFNYRLSRAQRTIENSFGILAQRWRILRKSIIADLDTCETIVSASVVLHNFLQCAEEHCPLQERRYCPRGFADSIDSTGEIVEGTWREEIALPSVNRLGSNNASESIKEDRDNLKAYFNCESGSVPGQLAIVTRGSKPE